MTTLNIHTDSRVFKIDPAVKKFYCEFVDATKNVVSFKRLYIKKCIAN